MTYDHTQHAPLWIILLLAAGMVVGVALSAPDGLAMAIAVAVAAPVALLSLCFKHLRVRDEGNRVSVRFGPIGLFGKRIRYSEITGVEAGRSTFLDGWGVHWNPRQGWIYNLWGFGCAVVRLGDKTIRIGTDDVEGLVRFLRSKAASGAAG